MQREGGEERVLEDSRADELAEGMDMSVVSLEFMHGVRHAAFGYRDAAAERGASEGYGMVCRHHVARARYEAFIQLTV
jgi:hypothetical protein